MKLPRSNVLRLAAGAAAVPAMLRAATAKGYPTRPITIVVPFPVGRPGGPVGDATVRRDGRACHHCNISLDIQSLH